MFKRILKILGIVLGGFVVITGAAFGITALTKGFDKVEIPITRIYFANDEGNTLDTARDIYTLDDITALLDFEPKNATNRTINVTVSDEVGVLDCDSKFTVTAGEEFTLKIKKDRNNNNYGGVATLEFRPEGGIAKASLRVVVDVEVPDDSLYFSGNVTDKISTSGKNFTMAITGNEQYVYLRSSLVNAFFLDAGDTTGAGAQNNLKSVDVTVKYYEAVDQGAGTVMRLSNTVNLSNLTVDHVFNSITGENNYYYIVPVTPSVNGQIQLTARMHRTYAIEKEYKDNNFDRLVTLLNSSNVETTEISYMLENYNKFLNKYLGYFTKSEYGYEFFAGLDSNHTGKVNISTTTGTGANRLRQIANNVQTSQEYIFLSCSALVNITQVNLTSLDTNNNTHAYNVFDSAVYSLGGTIAGVNNAVDIVDEFGLTIGISNESVANANVEKKNLFNELVVKPYIYVDKESYEADSQLGTESVWSSYDGIKIPVYAFEDQKPIVINDGRYAEELGYLLLLKLDSSAQTQSYKEFMTVDERSSNGNKYWLMNFNVPMVSSSESLDITKTKSLYLQFSVTGRDIETYEEITKTAYSRVFINYIDYEFNDLDVSNLAFENVAPMMTINRRLDNVGASMAEDFYTQNININTSSDKIRNYSDVSYKSIMYFVETESNNVNGNDASAGKKVITSGKYEFVDMNGNQLAFGEGTLVGERIPTYTEKISSGVKSQQYYIQALNASTTPIKLFAVVYLSDVDGYPIDVNGRRLSFDESPEEETLNQLVAFRISDLSDANIPQITIQSYVDNMNFYTVSQITKEFIFSEGEDAISANFTEGYLKRNNITSYIPEGSDTPLAEEYLDEIRDYLKLKLLRDKQFTLYATNFELDTDGQPTDKSDATYPIQLKDIYGNNFAYENNFLLNTLNNKQIALNNLAADFNHYSLMLNGGATVSADAGMMIMSASDDSNALMMKFTLTANETGAGSTATLYLNPTSSEIPYSSEIILSEGSNSNETHWVTYTINKLEVTDCHISYPENDSNPNRVQSFNRIYAKYGSTTTDGSLQFKTQEASSQGGSQYDMYYFGKVEDGVNTGISYIITNNLFDDGTGCTDLIDCSQQDPSSIEDYVSAFVATSNNTRTTYTNPSEVISLNEDLVLSSVDYQDGEYLQVSSHRYVITGGTITVAGVEYELEYNSYTHKHTYTFSKGSYFPVVNNRAIILGQYFNIDSTNGQRFIRDSGDNPVSISGTPKILVKTLGEENSYTIKNYVASNYLTDRSASVSSAISRIDVDENQEDIVNFVKGEEIFIATEDSNGEYYLDGSVYRKITNPDYAGTRYSIQQSFVEDPNGKYYKVGDAYTTELPSDPNNTTTYSKRGVTVYLMINKQFVTTGADGYEFSFTDVITYEIIQEEISIIGIEGNTETQLKDESINSNVFTVSMNAGETISLDLGRQGSNNYCLVASPKEDYFFNHVIFTASTDGIVRLRLNDAGDWTNSCGGLGANKLNIYAPSRLSDIDTKITVAYKVKTGANTTSTIEVVFNVHVTADIAFSELANTGMTKTENLYKVNIDTSTTDIDTLLHNYFDYQVTAILEFVDSNNHYATISGNSLTVGTSYALYDGTGIARDTFTCRIRLRKSGATNAENDVIVSRLLEFTINPTYVIDTTSLPSASDFTYLFDGQSIYHTYIRLYAGNSTIQQIRDNITLVTASAGNTLTQIYQGVFGNTGVVTRDADIPQNMIDIYQGSLRFTEGVDNVPFALPYTIYIHGVETYFSANGDYSSLSDGSRPAGNAGLLSTEINQDDCTITLTGNTFDINDYIRVFVTHNRVCINGENATVNGYYHYLNDDYLVSQDANGNLYIELHEDQSAPEISIYALVQDGATYNVTTNITATGNYTLYYGINTGSGYMSLGTLGSVHIVVE